MRTYKEKEIQIFKAAWALFTQKGFHDTKVSEIAKLARIGKGTVYEYFPSKEELAKEMVIYHLTSGYKELLLDLTTLPDPEAQMRHLAQHDIAQGIDLFKTLKILQMIDNFDKKTIKDSVMSILGRRYVLIRGIIERGIEQGQFTKDDPMMMTLMYSGMINNAMMLQHTEGQLNFEPDELVAFILRKLKS